jgi:hypothetical protein
VRIKEQVEQQNERADTEEIGDRQGAQTESCTRQKASGKTADAPERLERRHDRSAVTLLNNHGLGIDANVDGAFGGAEQKRRYHKQEQTRSKRDRNEAQSKASNANSDAKPTAKTSDHLASKRHRKDCANRDREQHDAKPRIT